MVSGDEGEQTQVVAAALEAGLTYFDTAPRYGDGRSELNLGRVLNELGASPIVATKVEIRSGDLDDIAQAVEKSVEGSLRRLHQDAIGVLHLHNRIGRSRAERANLGSGLQLSVDDVLGPRGVAEGFERVHRRGLVKAVGGCAFGGEMCAIRQVVAAGALSSLLVNYSLINPTAFTAQRQQHLPDYDGIAAGAAAAGAGVVALRVLEGGRLAGSRIDESLKPLGFLLEECETLAEAAIRFALAEKRVSSVLVGISGQDDLAAAVQAARRGPLAPSLMERLRATPPIAAA